MKTIVVLIVCIMMFGCAHSPMQFRLAPGTNQVDYQTALQECGGDGKQGGYFLFGPMIIIAPVVAVVEGVKYHKRGVLQKCMEAKGFKCTANCLDSSSDKLSEVPQKPVDPQLLDKWTQTIRADKEREWIFYAKDLKGFFFYYSPPSLSVVDQRYVCFRDQVKFPSETTKDISYAWRSVKVNCADKIFKLSDFVALDKAGNTTDPKMSETEWRSLPETSPLGQFAYKMCHEMITQRIEGNGHGVPSSTRDK
jgi:hypothetical protein